MKHSYDQWQESRTKLLAILDLALSETETMEAAALRCGIVSPIPAQATLIKRTVELAHSVVAASVTGSKFEPGDLTPPGPERELSDAQLQTV